MFQRFNLTLLGCLLCSIAQAEFAQQCKDLINEKDGSGKYIYWSGTKLKDKETADQDIRNFYLGKLFDKYVTASGVDQKVSIAIDEEIAELKSINDKKWSPNMFGSASAECIRVLGAYPKDSVIKALEFNRVCKFECPGVLKGVTKSESDFRKSVYSHFKGGDTDAEGLGKEINWFNSTCRALTDEHTPGWCSLSCTTHSDPPALEQVETEIQKDRFALQDRCSKYESILKSTLIVRSVDGKMLITGDVFKALESAAGFLSDAISMFNSTGKLRQEPLFKAHELLRDNGDSPGKPEILLKTSITLTKNSHNYDSIVRIHTQLKEWLHDCFPKPDSSPAVTCKWAQWEFKGF